MTSPDHAAIGGESSWPRLNFQGAALFTFFVKGAGLAFLSVSSEVRSIVAPLYAEHSDFAW